MSFTAVVSLQSNNLLTVIPTIVIVLMQKKITLDVNLLSGQRLQELQPQPQRMIVVRIQPVILLDTLFQQWFIKMLTTTIVITIRAMPILVKDLIVI